ncbi:hypothetical protein H5A35_06970 [Pectobacterium brasiliense]|uniref:hypothetical protein n=1 Tax=Pectobacterium brasiliense TaxID=180957 RepID=UPI001968E0F0|nr:hypothetical protein [Pectobacterium brasiliense]MBN3207154.1 hypothetical protein [Pectobacterium brasiliense]
MSGEWGVFSYLNGSAFDAINSLTDNYVVDVIQSGTSGSRTYPQSADYTIDAVLVNSPDAYAGGGQYATPATLTVSNGVVSWATHSNVLVTIIVVMKNG